MAARPLAGPAREAPARPASGTPAIVLVEPQLGENIGAAARAMLNFGLDDLRLVRPRDGWPNPAAQANAAGAVRVIDRAALFDSLEEAVADRRRVLATTARSRDMALRTVPPPAAAAVLRAAARRGEETAVLFGRESSGLDNDALALADTTVAIPAAPECPSLNLAMAVLLIAWEWRRAAPEADGGARAAPPPSGRAARKADLLALFAHLEAELDAQGYFRPPEKRAGMARTLRALFQRARPSEQEVRTLRGVIRGLARRTPPDG